MIDIEKQGVSVPMKFTSCCKASNDTQETKPFAILNGDQPYEGLGWRLTEEDGSLGSVGSARYF